MSFKKFNIYLLVVVVEAIILGFVIPKMISAKSDWVVVAGFGLLGLNVLMALNFLFFKYLAYATKDLLPPEVTPQEVREQTKSE